MADELKPNPPLWTRFHRGMRVMHKDGTHGVGTVERVNVTTVSVQFPYHHRTSVVKAENLTALPRDSEED